MGNITELLGHPLIGNVPKPLIEQVKDTFSAVGIPVPPDIIMDGRIHRFPTTNSPGDDSGWYVIHSDGIACGFIGSWRDDVSAKFIQDIGRELTPHEQQAHNRRVAEMRQIRREEEEKRHNRAASIAYDIWTESQAADENHEYLKRKQIKANGARIANDGRLVIPLYDNDGKISSIQYIKHNGEKRFLKGGKTKGCYCFIGQDEDTDKIYIAEGFATGATIYEETSAPTVCAFSASNIPHVAESIRLKHPGLKIIIVADNDQGEVGKNYADQAAAKTGASVIMPPEKGDVNDFRINGGNVSELLTPPEVKPWLESIESWFDNPAPIKWDVQGWIKEKSVSIVFGPSGIGKSFFVIDLAMHMVTKKEKWHGYHIKTGPIVYLAGEGHDGIKKRVVLWGQENQCRSGKMFVSRHSTDLDEEAQLQSAIYHISQLEEPPRMIVIDTLARFMSGDENSTKDAGAFVKACEKLQLAFNCTVLIVHHTGVSKEAQGRSRGSSAFKGAVDSEVWVRYEDEKLIAEPLKMKDSSKPTLLAFTMDQKPVDGWINEYGEQETSIVLSRTSVENISKEDKKLDEYKGHIKAAWAKSGCEIDDEKPYISRSFLSEFLMNEVGMTRGTANNNLAPRGGKMINSLLDSRIIKKFKNGYLIIEKDFAATMMLQIH